jgi:hypothetical protein
VKKEIKSSNSFFPIENGYKYLEKALLIVLLFNVISLIYYQFVNLKYDFYHEAAYPYLYAIANMETGTIFSSQFGGREIAPFSWPLVNHVLLLIGLPLSFSTVAISNLLFLFFLCSIGLWYCKTFQIDKVGTLVLLVLLTTGFGSRPFKYAWIDHLFIWPMNSYGLYEILSLLGCIFVLKMIRKVKPQESWLTFFKSNQLYFFVFLVFGLNHDRGVLQIYGPIGFSLLIMSLVQLFQKKTFNIRKYLYTFYLTFLAVIFGRLIIGLITFGTEQRAQEPAKLLTQLDSSNFMDKLASPIFNVMKILGVNTIPGLPFASTLGITIVSSLFLAILIVFFPISRYVKWKFLESLPEIAQLMFFHLIFFVIVSFTTALFTSSAGAPRYSIPLIISAFFFTPFVFSESALKRFLFLTTVLIILLPNTFHSVKQFVVTPSVDYKEYSVHKLADYLQDNRLFYGYAGHWTDDVLAIPFITNGKVHVSLVDASPIDPHWHADKSWFWKESHVGETFLAIPTAGLTNDPKSAKLRSLATSTTQVDKWTVYIFDFNPAEIIGSLN